MWTFELLLLIICAAATGCASAPTQPKSAVEAYRRFLLDTETQFPARAERHLGLKAEIDPETLGEPRFARLGPSQGNNAFQYASIGPIGRSSQPTPGQFVARMTAKFDYSVVCVRRADLAVLGPIYPGNPIVVHGSTTPFLRLDPTPDYVYFSAPTGPFNIELATFSGDCLVTMVHDISMVLPTARIGTE